MVAAFDFPKTAGVAAAISINRRKGRPRLLKTATRSLLAFIERVVGTDFPRSLLDETVDGCLLAGLRKGWSLLVGTHDLAWRLIAVVGGFFAALLQNQFARMPVRIARRPGPAAMGSKGAR
jgi:hypothetical protein